MNKDQLLKRLDKRWEALNASYAGLAESEMLQPGVSGDWSVKDIIAHVTVWEGEALKHLPLIHAGERTPKYADVYGGIDAFNALMVEGKKTLSLVEVLRQRDETHRRIMDYVQSVPEELYATETRFRKRLRFDTYGHYKLHAEGIRKWREGR